MAQIDNALAMLDDQERLVLERFYINRCPGYVDVLCQELGYERSHIYNIKGAALRHFTTAMYGLVEL